MRRVLVIAPCFSPSSAPPVLRNRLFAIHFESFGWRSIISTVEPRYLEQPEDLAFAKMIPAELEVVRSKAVPYQWTRRVGVGDLGLRSLWHQYRLADELCRKRKVDLLFISGPPWVTFLVGTLIKKRYGIPYVMDYIDPWVCPNGYFKNFFKKGFWAYRLASILEPIAVRNADAITSVSEGINDILRKQYPECVGTPFAVIPYGFEAKDFEWVKNNPQKIDFFNPNDNLCHISYVGVVWKNAYDTIEAIFRALQKIKQESPENFSRMRWHFIGTSYAPNASPQVLPIAKHLGVAEVVTEFTQRIPYAQALNVLLHTSVILAFGSNDPSYTSSKIFSSILAQKPILAIYHEQSSVVKIMKEAGKSKVVTFSKKIPVGAKIEEIKAGIKEIADGKVSKPLINWKAFEKYSARNMTKKLAAVFNLVCEMK